MKRFGHREVWEAAEYALAGGQALHVWDPGAPLVFQQNRPWAHLLNQDLDRLILTARRLGVQSVVVSKQGQREQHIDLCAGPLNKAIAVCEKNGD